MTENTSDFSLAFRQAMKVKETFTPVEWETVELMAQGHELSQIAYIVHKEKSTIFSRWENIRSKLNIGPRERHKLFWWLREVGLMEYHFDRVKEVEDG
jgi:DNA-binding NarL/FixJ family response regulator